MAFAETANLAVKLTLGGNFNSQMAKASRSLKTFDKDASRAYKAGQQIGTGIKRGAYIAAGGVAFLATQVGFGLDQLVELEKLAAQTNATLKSTGGTAGQTADSIRNLAEKYESLNATVDDKVIQSGENLLLTYTAVTKEAFEPALAAALDLSTALGTDLDSAIKTVGKALSDPAKAMGRLTRQGIILTKSEEDQIKAHLKNNKTLEAQRVILGALDKRYGGSFLAGGNTTAGKVAKFGDAIEDLQKNLAVALLPAVSNIADALNELFRDKTVIQATEELGAEIGKLFSKQNIKNGIDALKEGFTFMKSIVGPIASVVGLAVKAFTSLDPIVQKLLVGGFAVNKLTGGLVTNVIGAAADVVFKKLGLMTVQAGVVNVAGPVSGMPGAGGGASALGILPIASIAAAAAIVVDQVTREANTAIADQGFTGKFEVPGSGFLPFGIEASLKNIATALSLLDQNGKQATDKATQTSVTQGEKTRSAFNAQAEQQKAAIAAAANKNTTDAERIKGSVTTTGQRTVAEVQANAARVTNATAVNTGATQSGTAQIVSAIHSIDLTVQNTTISKTTTIQKRYGPVGGSRNDSRGDGFFGNGGFGG
jgi:hypothetical protein